MAKLVLHNPACTKNSDTLSTSIPDRPSYEKIVRLFSMTKTSKPTDTATPVVDILREMREAAGLSIREMADEAGYENHNSYTYYETDFKGIELPQKHRDKIAPVLLKHGIPAELVSRLGRLKSKQIEQYQGASLILILEELRELKKLLLERLTPNEERKLPPPPDKKPRAS